MLVYFANIRFAVYLFAVVVIPFCATLTWLQNYRHGRVFPQRTIATCVFVFFIFAAYAVTLAPLTEVSLKLCDADSHVRPVLVPFRVIANINAEYQLHGLFGTLTSTAFLKVAFNFLLLMPIGFFLHYLYKLNLITVLICAYLMSLSIEMIQLTGNFGLYPCPIRIFEVDDLILNTLGGGVGYFIVGQLSFLPALSVD